VGLNMAQKSKQKDKNFLSNKEKIFTDPNYIYCPRHNHSLDVFIEYNPEGATDEQIKRFLLISDEELKEIERSAIEKLKKALHIK